MNKDVGLLLQVLVVSLASQAFLSGSPVSHLYDKEFRFMIPKSSGGIICDSE